MLRQTKTFFPKKLLRGSVVVAVAAAAMWVSGPPITSVSADAPADASHQGDSTTLISVEGVDMVVHTFTAIGASTFTPPLAVSSVDYLVVGGGGGGGARYGGGGGGGGVISGTLAVTGGQGIAVTVGAGGAGGVQRASGVTQGPGMNGSASSLGAIVGSGGGGGGAGNAGGNTPGRSGASGGGGGGVINTTTVASGGAATQGSAGGAGSYGYFTADPNLEERYLGLVTGGGGGSTSAGGAGNHATRTAGAGGTGTSSSITGTALGYGGGGGGGAYTSEFFVSHQTPGNGQDGGGDGTNTDTTPTKAVRGGGGGGGGLSGESRLGSGGGDGGDGIVIVRYPVSSTTATITSSTSRTARTNAVTLTVTVEPSDTTGVVTISEGTTVSGTCTLTRAALGSCTVELADLAVGTRSFIAAYAGNAAYQNSTSTPVSVQIDPVSGDVIAHGFARPIDMNGVVNTAKGGSTIPLKFSATIDGAPVSDLSYVTKFAVTHVSCTTRAPVSDEVEMTTSGGTQLRYDHTAQQFVLNWKLPSTKNLCYRVQASVLGVAQPITAYVMTR
jgi:hypothetical protein